MSVSKPMRSLFVAMALLVLASVSAFAENSTSVALSSSVSLNGTLIKAGRYSLTWEQHSPDATVTFSDGKKAVATARGRIVDRGIKYRRNMVVDNRNPDGSRVIVEIRLGGTTQAIVFD